MTGAPARRTQLDKAVRERGSGAYVSRGGNAIAAGDKAFVVATGQAVGVIAVDHQAGTVRVRPVGGGPETTYAGIDLQVTEAVHHPPLDDDCMEGLTLAEAKVKLTEALSDWGRYPQYTGYFAAESWVLARARRDVRHPKWRQDKILLAGQRLLVNTNPRERSGCEPPGPPTYTAVITRCYGGRGTVMSVEISDVEIEPTTSAEEQA